MPTIPLITQEQPLSKLPDAVLDRERRPTVDYSGIIQGMARMTEASKMPEISRNAFSAPYEAMEYVGRAVADAGSVLGAYAIKKMEVESDVQVARAEELMRDTVTKFEDWKVKNPEQAKWMPEWDRRLAETKTQIFEKTKLHNLAYNRLVPQFTRYASDSKAGVEVASAKATFAEGKSVIMQRLAQAEKTQNKSDHEDNLRRGADLLLLTPKEVEAFKVSFTQTGEQQQQDAQAAAVTAWYDAQKKAATDDPEGWMQANSKEWKGDEDNYHRIRNVAALTMRQNRAAGAKSLAEGIAKQDYKQPGDLGRIKGLTPAIRKEGEDIVKGYDPVKAAESRRDKGTYNSAEVRAEIAVTDRERDPEMTTYLGLLHKIGTIAHEEDAADLTNALQRRYGLEPTMEDKRPEHVRALAKTIDGMFDSKQGLYAWSDTVKVERDAKGITMTRGVDMENRRRSIALRGAIDKEMKDWARDNPQKARNPEEYNKQAGVVLQKAALVIMEDRRQRQEEAEWRAQPLPPGWIRVGAR